MPIGSSKLSPLLIATVGAVLALLACSSKSEPAPESKDSPTKVESPAPQPPPASASATPEAAPVQVAAAADLVRAFGDIGRAFEAETKRKVVFSFGSSGLLAQQIRQGAPFDMFAAANVAFTDDLVEAGVCDGTSQARYARGRIVVWTKKGLVEPPKNLDDLKDARFRRIAIANPEHAPYGAAAQQALQRSNLWKALEPRIVYGENIKQTQQFAQSGNAEAAIVARSLVIDDEDGVTLPIDSALHKPIEQALIVCKNGKNTAGGRAFAAFVQSEKAHATLQHYGFELPEAPPKTP